MLPTDAQERKNTPIYTGFMCFFPLAIAAVAQHSHASTEQHHPGEPCHWDKSKSTDERDSQARHLLNQAISISLDEEIEHAKAGAWRAMANLERLLTDKARQIENSKSKKLPEDISLHPGAWWRGIDEESVAVFRDRTAPGDIEPRPLP